MQLPVCRLNDQVVDGAYVRKFVWIVQWLVAIIYIPRLLWRCHNHTEPWEGEGNLFTQQSIHYDSCLDFRQ